VIEVWPDDGRDYVTGSAHLNAGAAGGEITCITERGGQVYFKHDDGAGGWSMEPVPVGVIETGGKACHVHYTGRFVKITNGTTFNYRSAKYGKADTWEAF